MTKAIKDRFKLALAQLNPVLGDIEGNLNMARAARTRASEEGADLVAFTELFRAQMLTEMARMSLISVSFILRIKVRDVDAS